MGLEYQVHVSGKASMKSKLLRNGHNTALKLKFKKLKSEGDAVTISISAFGQLDDNLGLPEDLSEVVTGFQFSACAQKLPQVIVVRAIGTKGNILDVRSFELSTDLQSFDAAFDATDLSRIDVQIGNYRKSILKSSLRPRVCGQLGLS